MMARFDVSQRRRATLEDFYWGLSGALVVSIMGSLARLPNTSLVRLGLMPIGLYMVIMGTFGIDYFDPRVHKAWNFLVGE